MKRRQTPAARLRAWALGLTPAEAVSIAKVVGPERGAELAALRAILAPREPKAGDLTPAELRAIGPRGRALLERFADLEADAAELLKQAGPPPAPPELQPTEIAELRQAEGRRAQLVKQTGDVAPLERLGRAVGDDLVVAIAEAAPLVGRRA